MRIKSVLAFLFVAGLAAGAFAQTKTSGTVLCKQDPPSPVVIDDKPNHAFAVGKAHCTWTGFAVAGVPSKTGVSTDQEEITGDGVSVHGYHVATLANGDTTVAEFKGTGTMKDGKPVGGEGTWVYTGGTGKMKGIKGKGSYKGKGNADGSITYEITGEYSLP